MNALVSNVLTQVFITLIAVSGIYVLTGLTGMFSLGQAAFMAIGSYVSGLLVIRAHVPFALAALLAVAGATLIGYVIGYPVVRLRRDYISLVTLGFGEAIAALLNRMTTLTGGASGLTGIPRLVGLPLAFVSAVLAIALAAFFKTSKYGRQCIALKGDELAAKAMGINVTRVKMIAFLLSVALTSYSGVLYAFYMSYVDPTGFGWKKSADWVIMVFFGGVNSLTGSTLGAFILSALPQALRGLQNYRYVIYAVLVLLILNFKPSGLLGEWELTPRNLQQAFAKLGKGSLACVRHFQQRAGFGVALAEQQKVPRQRLGQHHKVALGITVAHAGGRAGQFALADQPAQVGRFHGCKVHYSIRSLILSSTAACALAPATACAAVTYWNASFSPGRRPVVSS